MNQETLELRTTKDGSHTLYNPNLNETYHSMGGAISESEYVYIDKGLRKVSQRLNNIKVLELGFGTGLNCLLTLSEALDKKLAIEYSSIENFRLNKNYFERLNYPEHLNIEKSLFLELHNSDWNKKTAILPNFILNKIDTDIKNWDLIKQYYDLIYFDAFAKSKQPDLWNSEIIEKIAESMSKNAVFVTYSSTTSLKKQLKNLHLEVEILPGALQKREMIRAIKM